MGKQNLNEHHIQQYIISILTHQEFARFSDLRPPSTDTNLFSYHLKVQMKSGCVEKTDKGYTLGRAGLIRVDRMSNEKIMGHAQPKIISMLVIQNSDGDILLQKRTKQPYINTWTLPYGKVRVDDLTVEAAGQRVASEILHLVDQRVVHAGDAYVRVYSDGVLLSTTLAHISRFENDDVVVSDTIAWARPHKLSNYRLAPAVQEIVARSFFGDDHFFAEFNEDWTC